MFVTYMIVIFPEDTSEPPAGGAVEWAAARPAWQTPNLLIVLNINDNIKRYQ